MIDLHLHLDGSLPPSLLIRLAEAEGVVLPGRTEKELIPYLTAPKNCASLNEYLEKFSLPVSCMQSVKTLTEAARGLACALAEEKMMYAEIRFAPQLHLQKGLSQKRVIEAVRKGLGLAGEEAPSLKTGLILCCMRGEDNQAANRETVSLAAEFLGDGVCALDLAGAEALFPTENFSELFQQARDLGVPFTIHAGEAAGPESIRWALSFGAGRLGHGVRVVESPLLLEEVIRKRIPLELCMTSNLQTKALPIQSPDEYPLLSLLRRGAAVTVNTDNMTVSGTTIEKEFSALRGMGMTVQEEKQLLLNAAEAAFLPEKEREELRWRIEKGK